MLRQRNTGKESREEVAMEKLVGIWWGQRVGKDIHQFITAYLDKFGSTGEQIEGVNVVNQLPMILSLLQV